MGANRGDADSAHRQIAVRKIAGVMTSTCPQIFPRPYTDAGATMSESGRTRSRIALRWVDVIDIVAADDDGELAVPCHVAGRPASSA